MNTRSTDPAPRRDDAWWRLVHEHVDARRDPLADPRIAAELSADPERAAELAALLDRLDAVACSSARPRRTAPQLRRAAVAAVALLAAALVLTLVPFAGPSSRGGAAPPPGADPAGDRAAPPGVVLRWQVRVTRDAAGVRTVRELRGARHGDVATVQSHTEARSLTRTADSAGAILAWSLCASAGP
ncbi:MAG: hypothetical protein IPM29_30635 [Planctomycetes bacterium]|nr:hypothetical protein [Planctomycetota bacterium]